MNGCNINYTLNIIDTPGFGDTRGITRDKQLIDRMRELFATHGDQGVAVIDAVCFITQAPQSRLSHTQRYIFDGILSIFGLDIKENMFAFMTFADTDEPPVLAALEDASFPYVEKFVFNNSALFSKKTGKNGHFFWNMGMESFKTFLERLPTIEAKSIQMTKQVLQERYRLDTIVQGLHLQVQEGLHKMDALQTHKREFKQHQSDIAANENFTYTFKATYYRAVPLKRGQHITNCLRCNTTCHFPCLISEDNRKEKCAVMFSGKCAVCPDRCQWNYHKNNQFSYEPYTEDLTTTKEEIKKQYEEATGKAKSTQQLIQCLESDYEKQKEGISKMIIQICQCLTRLSEIALKSNPLPSSEYIDLLIETEKRECDIGYQERIKSLQECREKAHLIEQAPGGTYPPLQKLGISGVNGPFDEIN